MRRPGYVVVIVSLTISLLEGCGSATQRVLQGSMNTDRSTNPDVNGRASPIVVRVYELRSPGAFTGADFFSLFDKEAETLGADLVGREEYDLRPAENRPYRRQLQPDTKFIGVAAAFRDLEHARWRQIVEVPAKRESSIAISVESRAVTVTLDQEGPSGLSRMLPWRSKESLNPSLTPSLTPSRDSLLAQTSDMMADLAAANSRGKLTPEQARQVADLIPKVTALKGELQNPSLDVARLPGLTSDLLDLQRQVGALKGSAE